MSVTPHRDLNDREFTLWLAEAVEHIDHLLVSIRVLLIVQIIVIVLLWFFR